MPEIGRNNLRSAGGFGLAHRVRGEHPPVPLGGGFRPESSLLYLRRSTRPGNRCVGVVPFGGTRARLRKARRRAACQRSPNGRSAAASKCATGQSTAWLELRSATCVSSGQGGASFRVCWSWFVGGAIEPARHEDGIGLAGRSRVACGRPSGEPRAASVSLAAPTGVIPGAATPPGAATLDASERSIEPGKSSGREYLVHGIHLRSRCQFVGHGTFQRNAGAAGSRGRAACISGCDLVSVRRPAAGGPACRKCPCRARRNARRFDDK